MREALSKEALSQAGLTNFGTVAANVPDAKLINEGATRASMQAPVNIIRQVMRKFLDGQKLPAFKELEIRQRAERMSGLDADLISLVSVSPSYKITTQRKRNLERLRQMAIGTLILPAERDEWEDKMEKQTDSRIHWYG